MIWTLIAFGMTLYVLRRFAFPRIQEALDKRQRAIEETIEQPSATGGGRRSCWPSTASA